MQEDIGSIKGFQSTRPLRGETKSVPECCRAMVFFNPLAPCGARHASMQQAYGLSDFSIHSPLAGRDLAGTLDYDKQVKFSIHSPLAGRDHTYHCIRRI